MGRCETKAVVRSKVRFDVQLAMKAKLRTQGIQWEKGHWDCSESG